MTGWKPFCFWAYAPTEKILRLAEDGFYCNDDHCIQCFCCQIVATDWLRDGFDAAEVHRRSKCCRFLKGEDSGNVELDHARWNCRSDAVDLGSSSNGQSSFVQSTLQNPRLSITGNRNSPSNNPFVANWMMKQLTLFFLTSAQAQYGWLLRLYAMAVRYLAPLLWVIIGTDWWTTNLERLWMVTTWLQGLLKMYITTTTGRQQALLHFLPHPAHHSILRLPVLVKKLSSWCVKSAAQGKQKSSSCLVDI